MGLVCFKRLSSVASVQAAPGNGAAKLHGVNVNKGTATAIVTVYNGTTTSDPVVAVIDGASKGFNDYKGLLCPKGIFVDQTVAGADVTILYS